MPWYQEQIWGNIKVHEQIASPTSLGRLGLVNMARLLILMWPNRQGWRNYPNEQKIKCWISIMEMFGFSATLHVNVQFFIIAALSLGEQDASGGHYESISV